MAMAVVELQISKQALLVLVRSRFTQGDLGVGNSLNVPGHQYLIQQLNVLPDTDLQADQPDSAFIRYQDYPPKDWVYDSVTTKQVEFTQSLDTALQELVTAPDGTKALQDKGIYTTHVRIRLNAWIDWSGTPVLTMSLVSVDPDVPDPQLKAALTTFAQGLFTYTSSPIKLFGDATYANAGVMASPDRSRVAVRVEVGPGTEFSAQHWQSFYNGNIADHLNVGGPLPWSVFIDGGVVELQVWMALSDGLNAHPDKLRLNGSPSVSWAPNNLSPELDASFNADAINACQTPRGVVKLGDVNLDFTSHLVLGMATDAAGNLLPNHLVSRTHIDWDANDLDVVECAELFGGAVGGVGLVTGAVVGGLFGPSGIAPGAAVGIAGVFFAVIIAASVYTPTIQQPNCNQVSDHDLICQQTLPVALSKGGVLPPMQFTQVAGLAEGLVLSGAINMAALSTAAVPQLSLESQDFHWAPPVVSCGSVGPDTATYIIEHLDTLATAIATISLTNAGTGSLVLRDTELLSPDPDGVFAGHIQTYQYDNSAVVEVRCPFNPTYATHPYPCSMLIRTTGGNAIVTLGPIPALDANTRQRLEAEVIGRIGACNIPIDDWWRHFHRFNPHWLIDQPPEGAQVERWEMIEVQGISEGAGVLLDDGQGAEIGVAWADAAGMARIGLVMSSRDADPGLTRLQEDRGGMKVAEADAVTASEIRIVTRQVELVEQTRLVLGDDARGIAASILDGTAHVFALVGPALHLYRLANPQRPLLVRLFPAVGTRRFVVAGRYVALAGELGIAVYMSDGRQLELARVTGDVTDLTVFRDAVMAVADGRMFLLSLRDLTLHDLEPLQGAKTLAATSRHLVVGTEGDLAAYESDGRLLHHVGTAEIAGIETLLPLPGLHPRTGVLGVRRDGTALVVDFLDPRQPRILTEYRSVPHFMAMARVGNLLVAAGNGGNAGSLTVATIGRNLRA